MDPFDELVERVKALTGLNLRASCAIAQDFAEEYVPSAAEIIERARDLGYDFTARTEKPRPLDQSIGAEISMDPATVLAEVYEVCPRVLMANFPCIGRAPTELEAHPDLMAEIEQLPDEIRVLLAKVNVADEQLTVWLRDEANDVDRPIGPISLRPYRTGQQLHDAIMTLLGRLPRVLRADSN